MRYPVYEKLYQSSYHDARRALHGRIVSAACTVTTTASRPGSGDTPEFRLTALRDGDETIAGIMDGSGFLRAGQPGRWGIYIKVTDADDALAKIT